MADTDITLTVGLDASGVDKQLNNLMKEVERQAGEAQKALDKISPNNEGPAPDITPTVDTKALDEARAHISALQTELEQLQSTLGAMTMRYFDQLVFSEEAAPQMEHVNELLEEARDLQEQLIETPGLESAEQRLQQIGEEVSTIISTLSSTGDVWEGSTQQINELQEQVNQLTVQVAQLEEELRQVPEDARRGSNETSRNVSLIEQMAEVTNGILQQAQSSARTLPRTFGSGINRILTSLKRMAATVVGIGLGVRGIQSIINKIRSATMAGFKEFAKGNKDFEKKTKKIKETWEKIQVAMAAVAEPIVSMIIPHIQALLDWILALLAQVSKLTAVIAGNNKYAQSIKKVGDAAKGANKQLAKFDELNNLTETGGPNYITQYAQLGPDEATIESWFEVGEKLSIALRDALRNIPWDDIQKEVASWSRKIAEFLNGFIRPDTFYEVGRTIAEAINTAIIAAYEFGNEFDFENFGTSLANIVKGWLENFDFELLADTIDTWVQGIWDTIKSFLFGKDGVFNEDGRNLLKEKAQEFFGHLDIKTVEIALLGFSVAALAPSVIASLTSAVQAVIPTLAIAIPVAIASFKLGEALSEYLDEKLGTDEVTGETNWYKFWEGIFDDLEVDVMVTAFEDKCSFTEFFERLEDDLDKDYEEYLNKDTSGMSWWQLFWHTLGTQPNDTDLEDYKDFYIGPFEKLWQSIFDETGFSDYVNNNDIHSFGDLFSQMFEDISTNADEATSSVSGFVNVVSGAKSKKIADSIQGWADKFKEVGDSAYDAGYVVGEDLRNQLDRFKTTVDENSEEVKIIVKNKVADIKTDISNKITDIKLKINEVKNDISGKASEIKNNISGKVAEIKTDINNKISEIKNSISTAINDATGKIAQLRNDAVNNVSDIRNNFLTAFTDIKNNIVSRFDEIRNNISGVVSTIKINVTTIVHDIKSNIQSLPTTISDTMNSIGTNLYNHFVAILTMCGSLLDGIYQGAVNMGNALLKMLPDLISKICATFQPLVDKLNDIGNKIEEATGVSIPDIPSTNNVNTPTSSIGGHSNTSNKTTNTVKKPSTINVTGHIRRGATGLVIPPNEPFLAMFGDQRSGTNVEAPLDTIKQAFEEVMMSAGFAGGGDLKVNLVVDGRVLANTIVKQNDLFKKSTGRSLI